MHRRIRALVLALVTVGAPLAADICEASCATRDAAARASHHSCHQVTAPQQGASMVAIHVCGHDDGAPTLVERSVQNIISPAVVPTISAAVVSRPTPQSVATPFDSSPPTSLNLISQLRV